MAPLAQALIEGEDAIMAELLEVQGQPMDIGGYYFPDATLADTAMRPSPTLAAALAAVGA